MKYYEINETAARQAREMWSFRDYEKGEETGAYRSQVDKCYSLVDKLPDDLKEKGVRKVDKIESMFSVNGYNKDADTYVPYGLFGTYIEAKTHLNTLLPLLRKGLLTDRRTKEPIDWLNIVENNKILASFT